MGKDVPYNDPSMGEAEEPLDVRNALVKLNKLPGIDLTALA
jgi:hypothetical protein